MAWIHAVVDAPADRHAMLATFWSHVLDWPVGDPWPDHPELRSFEPPRGEPYVHLQEIDGPARVHLDLESEDPAAAVARAVDLGAALVRETDDWRTLSSPGGLPFCVLEVGRHEAPGPAVWPDGHRSRMVQVCIDSPASAHEREVAFWRAFLGERWVPAPAPEFAGKWHDDAGSPLQLLFQRLDEPDGPVRAHLDHGTDDLSGEVRRVLGLGAADIGRGRGWHAVRDAAGLAFCVTDNSPEQTRHRDIG
jgi:glyoxalase superfamily protein